jgi:dCMP deaminase
VRPDHDTYFSAICKAISERGSCGRRQVGCVLVDADNKILSTGYNGPACGMPNCIDHPCPGRFLPSGEGLDLCEAIHAEQNALLQCPDTTKIHTAYCSASPCVHCVKLLMNTSCVRVVFSEKYPHLRSEELWKSKGEWVHAPYESNLDENAQ